MACLDFPVKEQFELVRDGVRFFGKRCGAPAVPSPKFGYTPHKCRVEAFQGDRKLGYFSFYVSKKDGVGDLYFGGILVEEWARGHGFASLFLDTLERFAFDEGFRFDATVPQRKPLTCRLLVKRGFVPLPDSPLEEAQHTVYVGGREDGGSTPLFFPHPVGRREFTSVGFGHAHYRLVEDIGGVQDAVRVILKAPYLKC